MKRQPLFRLYAESKKNTKGLFCILAISLLAGVLKMLAATLWGRTVDLGVSGQLNEMLFSVAAMTFVILFDCSRTALHYHIIGHVTESMFLDVRAQAFQTITNGDVAVLEQNFRTGDIATRLNNDIDFLGDYAAGHVSNSSRLIFQGVFAIAGCVSLSWQMSSVYFVILPLTLWFVNRISKPIEAQTKKSMDRSGAAMNIAADAIGGALTIKAFGIEDTLAEKFGSAIGSAYEQTAHSEKLTMKMTGVKYLANVIQTMTLFIFGSVLVTNGDLSVGTLIAILMLSNYIIEPFDQIDEMISTLRKANATAERFYEMTDTPEECDGTVQESTSTVPCEASDLTFAYTEELKILKGVSIKIATARQVAIVGPSGGGKSTFIKLLCRFHLKESGSLKLFGVEASDWQCEALRKNITLVTQNSCLFDGSIYENIAYGRQDLSRDECKIALMEVGLWDFVSTFRDGMDHQIGESGFQLSGGQKQRLCIARAIVKKAPLVLLDEATSALDTQTELEVQEALDKLLIGRSAVIITHRLTTVQKVDYIYYMDGGKIIEEGPPAQLLRNKGKYFEMCCLQGLLGKEAMT